MRTHIVIVVFATAFLYAALVGYDPAGAFIEIKEYKVINSQKVCGDRLCNKIDEKRSEEGLSTQSIKICGDRTCSEISDIDKTTSPLDQFRSGIPLNLIKCRDALELVLKQSDRTPACVKSETVEKLVQIGWALQREEQVRIILALSDIKQEKSERDEARLSITPDIIDGKRYLIFEGYGWHRLHNVEITIIKDDKVLTSIRSKTTDNGTLHMPWPIPENLPMGMYEIFATDGLHQNMITMPISGQLQSAPKTTSTLEVKIDGEKQVRQGTTHNIEVHVSREHIPIEGAKVIITIEDYGEDVIREFDGYTNRGGYFVMSWEIPKSFDDLETLLAFVDVTDGISSKTELFKFQVYCLPGEKGCKVEGN